MKSWKLTQVSASGRRCGAGLCGVWCLGGREDSQVVVVGDAASAGFSAGSKAGRPQAKRADRDRRGTHSPRCSPTRMALFAADESRAGVAEVSARERRWLQLGWEVRWSGEAAAGGAGGAATGAGAAAGAAAAAAAWTGRRECCRAGAQDEAAAEAAEALE